ncbi:MAG: type IVB secretion system protein IcmJDotN [Gammaproteobacteria bacterium]
MITGTLKLSATPGAWRIFMSRKTAKAFRSIAQQVLERDHYTCQYCGFQAQEYQEIVNQNGDFRNNQSSNLATACCFCAQCFFLETVGKNDYGGGTVIYLPEIAQTSLNGLCHVLFCAMTNATHYRAEAESIYRSLKLRSQTVEEQLGAGMSDPAVLGQILIDAQMPNRQKDTSTLLQPLRLLPSYTLFQKQIETWAAAALNELSGEKIAD